MIEKPTIYIADWGRHNADLNSSIVRLEQGNTYKDCSTIAITPTRGFIHARVVQAHMGLMAPMNQKFTRIFATGMEVGDAYSTTVEQILCIPELSEWKYIFTLEDDNIPPPDCLIKLIESIEGGVDGQKYDAVGALYWTKGEGGQPMLYGNPKEFPLSFRPQLPNPGKIVSVNILNA